MADQESIDRICRLFQVTPQDVEASGMITTETALEADRRALLDLLRKFCETHPHT